MMRNLMVGALFLVSGILVWHNTAFLRAPKPCEEPIPYTVGSIDKRFGLSEKDLVGALASAEAIWEKSLGKELFVYAPDTAVLPVNLIYDYRQETTSVLSDLGQTLEQKETTYEMLQAKYEVLKTGYDKAKGLYEERVKIFNANNRAYEAQVESWNNGPRTSKSQFEKLESAREALEREARELKTMESELNRVVSEINALVSQLNAMAESLNLNVKAYNTIGASRGESFTGGIYTSSGQKQSIDIFEFSSTDKLVRILAHELGHALGLEHNDDPKAIMYYLNEGTAKVLSAKDLSDLKTLCGIE